MCGRDKGSRERSNGAGQENGRREATVKGKGQGEATGQRVKV